MVLKKYIFIHLSDDAPTARLLIKASQETQYHKHKHTMHGNISNNQKAISELEAFHVEHTTNINHIYLPSRSKRILISAGDTPGIRDA